MEEMSACPKCKQPAVTRQARLAPEMDSLVQIFQSLESAAGPIIANSEDSQLEDLPDIRNVAMNVKKEDECLSPSALKRQRRQESRERVSSTNTGAAEADSRKRDASSMELPCRGILPAPKRIQLPCPPLLTDRSEVNGANLEKKETVSNVPPTLETINVDTNANSSEEQQKQPVFAHARIGGQTRSTGSAGFLHVEKVPAPMGVQDSNCQQTEGSGKALGNRNEYAALHANDHAQDVNGVQCDPVSQQVHASNKQEFDMHAGGEREQIAGGNARNNNTLPNQADPGTEKVKCAFCHTSNSEAAGPMIHYKKGVPVSASKRSDKIFSVHKNCAEWAPGVYYEDDIAKNIPQEIARGQKIKCHVCGLRGAVLGCYVKRCRKSFHYPCAHTLSCRWDDGNFLVLCPEHVASRFPNEGVNGSSSKLVNAVDSTVKEGKPRQALFADGCGHQSSIAAAAAATPPPPPMDAYVPGAPSLVEACNNELSQQWPPSKGVLCGSGLSPKASDLLATFASYSGFVVEKTWSASVTHLIAGTDEVGAARRTFKYLMANLEGKWILKIDWLSACMAANRYVNEEPYEVNIDIHGMIGGPRRARGMAIAKVHRLFEGLRFYFLGEYSPAYRADLQALISSAGGLVVNRLPDSAESNEKPCLILIYSKDMYSDTSASHREELNKSRYLEGKSLAGMVGAKVAGHTWILDSVAAYELQPFE